MNYISSYFGQQNSTESNERVLTQEQQDYIKHLQQCEGVFKVLSEHEIEDILCIDVVDIEFSEILKKKDQSGQEKKTRILNSQISFRIQDVDTEDGVSISIPSLFIENSDFDENQDQEKDQHLPVSKELVFVKYEDDEEDRVGYVLFYPQKNKTFLFESDRSETQKKSLQILEETLCELMYAMHKNSDPKKEKDQSEIQKFCLQGSHDLIYKSKDLYFIIQNQEEEKEGNVDAQAKNVTDQNQHVQEQILEEELEAMEIESEDIIAFDQIKMLIDERLIMTQGHLFKYDSEKDINCLVAKDSFLCIDRMAGQNKYQYIFNVTDPEQTVSYTRLEIRQEPAINYSFSEIEKILMWIGQPKEGSVDIPAWSFMVKHQQEVPRVKGVLTKVLYEINHKEDIEKAQERDDNNWLQAQVIGDQEENANMEGIEKVESYEWDQFFENDQSEIQDYGDEDDNQDLENSESIQAQGYDRTFVVSGPVIKVYKDADHQDNQRAGLVFDSKLPSMSYENGDVIEPQSIILHKGESSLLFTDKNDSSQIFNFDLETGKIVEQFQANINMSELRHLTNQQKNGQSSEESTFVAVNEKAIFTLDPRLNKKDKSAQEKLYKTNPQFNKVATTVAGGLAIGSLNGEIRLYKQVGQNAKTLLPGLGCPIRALDMSVDGKWIVATTQTYILVVPTECSNGKLGFEHRMGSEKPNPKKLQIHVKDLAKYKLTSIDFTPARFNNYGNSNGEHTSIVASTGSFLITWNFKKIQRGLLRSYQITKVDQKSGSGTLVDAQCKFNDDESILLAGQKEVGVQKRNKKTFVQY